MKLSATLSAIAIGAAFTFSATSNALAVNSEPTPPAWLSTITQANVNTVKLSPKQIAEYKEYDRKLIDHINKKLDNESRIGNKAYEAMTMGQFFVSTTQSSGSTRFAGHAAMVATNTRFTVESFAESHSPVGKDGVVRLSNKWEALKGAIRLRPKDGPSPSAYASAAAYTERQIGKPYNWNFLDKWTTDAFYCSQLVWRAWKDNGVNIDTIPGPIVSPAELVNSFNTKVLQKY